MSKYFTSLAVLSTFALSLLSAGSPSYAAVGTYMGFMPLQVLGGIAVGLSISKGIKGFEMYYNTRNCRSSGLPDVESPGHKVGDCKFHGHLTIRHYATPGLKLAIASGLSGLILNEEASETFVFPELTREQADLLKLTESEFSDYHDFRVHLNSEIQKIHQASLHFYGNFSASENSFNETVRLWTEFKEKNSSNYGDAISALEKITLAVLEIDLADFESITDVQVPEAQTTETR